MRLSASQLSDYDRCGLLWKYKREPDRPKVGFSAAVFGQIMHHALHVLERTWATELGVLDQNALDAAIANFTHYWHPSHMEEIGDYIQEWMRGHTWTSLNEKGPRLLTDYADLRRHDQGTTLALEFEFEVPLAGTDHTVSGFIDKLSVRHYNRQPVLSADDFKSGRTKTYLRHDVQGHIYCYASTQREFWTPFGDRADELWQTYLPVARRFRWVSLPDNKNVDTWRCEADYHRLRLMANQVAKAIEHEIFIPTLSGAVCEYCDFRDSCGDAPLPEDTDGRPVSLPRMRRTSPVA